MLNTGMCFTVIFLSKNADRDVMEVAREIVATITDPQGMVGPEVCN